MEVYVNIGQRIWIPKQILFRGILTFFRINFLLPEILFEAVEI